MAKAPEQKPASSLETPSMFKGVDVTDRIADASKDIGNQVKDLKNQAVDAYQSGASTIREGVTFVKDTQKDIANTITAWKSKVLDQISSVLSDLTGGWLDMGDLEGLISFKNGKFEFDTDGLLRKVSDQVGFNVSSMEAFKQDLSDKLLSEFNAITDEFYGDLKNITGDFIQFNTNDWRNDIDDSFLDMLSRLGLNEYDGVQDVNVNNAFNNIIFEELVDKGMTDGFESMLDRYDTEEEKQNALLRSVRIAANHGDYYSLRKLVDLMTPYTVTLIKPTYPELPKTFLTNYTMTEADTKGNYQVLGLNVKTLLTETSGTGWWLLGTEHGKVIDFSISSMLSHNAQTIFMDDKELGVLVCAAGKFYDAPAVQIVKQYFPGAIDLDDYK